MIYDADIDRLLIASGDGNALITLSPDVDPKTGAIDPPIKLGGAPEYLASDGNGKVYINLEDEKRRAVVDLKARKVTAQWPVAPGGHPVGIAIDAESHRLFIGCRNPQKLIVMNTENGKIEASLPLAQELMGLHSSNGHVFVSCGDGSLVIASGKLGKFEIDQTIKARDHGHSRSMERVRASISRRRISSPSLMAGPKSRPAPLQFWWYRVISSRKNLERGPSKGEF